MSTETVSRERHEAPDAIQGENLTAWVLRDIWRRVNVHNEWFVFGIVGREGHGKSLTCASILRHLDPTFGVERAHFRPEAFIDTIRNRENHTGHAVMGDEVGAWLGNRTWHDEGQIKLNQVLQTARDDNLIIGLTLPRLEELDKQTEGRFHALIEMQAVKDDEFSVFSFKNWMPTRDGRDKVYKKYPRLHQSGRECRVTRLRIGPPPSSFVDEYEPKKAAWKDEFYDEAEDELVDDEDEDTPEWRRIAEDILDDDPEQYIRESNTGEYYDRDLIEMDYNVGARTSNKVKKFILEKTDIDVQ